MSQHNQHTENSASTFSERLIEALNFQGITDHAQQVEKVAQACEVTPRTARKYLQSTGCPIGPAIRLLNLADAVEADFEWLFNGSGRSLIYVRFLKSWEPLTEWKINKLNRLIIRLNNHDAKAQRLLNMCAAGQISRHQLLAAM